MPNYRNQATNLTQLLDMKAPDFIVEYQSKPGIQRSGWYIRHLYFSNHKYVWIPDTYEFRVGSTRASVSKYIDKLHDDEDLAIAKLMASCSKGGVRL